MTTARRLVAVAAAVAVLSSVTLAGCSTKGSTSSATTSGPGSSTTTSAPGGPASTTTSAGTASTQHDYPDATFPNLGDPRIDVLSEAVRVRADPKQAPISGHVTIRLRSLETAPLPTFTLDLRGPKVTELTVDGTRASVTATKAELTITPTTPLAPGRTVTAEVDYAGTPDETTFPVLGVPVGWQADDRGGWFTMSEPNGTETWVPVNDYPADKVVWTVTLDTPDGVTGVSNGQLVSHRSSGGRTLWRWREHEPMASYLVLVAIGAYDLVSHAGPDHTRVLFAFPHDLAAADRHAFDRLDDIIAFYAQTFGGRADDDAGAILVDRNLSLALETQTRPLFGTDAIFDGKVGALAHELGHQWFGDEVTTADWRDLWLNEGFATYADWLYQDHAGTTHIDDVAAQTAQAFAHVGLTVRDPQAAGTFDMVVYNRGALTLHALRKTVGDATFFAILRTWVRTYHGRSATTEDFVRLSSRLAHRDLTAFFSSWLDHAPQPALPK